VTVATRPPAVGDRVTSVGLAEPGLLRVRSGPVTALRAFDGTFESVMPSQQGDSGGPTFNARGELVGVHCANITRSDGTGRGVQTSLSYDATRLALTR
jgi:S1-C subfamily serine protease